VLRCPDSRIDGAVWLAPHSGCTSHYDNLTPAPLDHLRQHSPRQLVQWPHHAAQHYIEGFIFGLKHAEVVPSACQIRH
jgi:hypothetical protein